MKNVKYIIGIALLLGFIALVILTPEGGDRKGSMGPEEGYPAPDFTLQDLNGKSWSLSGLRGSVVLLNFWATWCPPCKEEMPSLNSLFDNNAGNPEFVILTVLYQDDPEKASSYLRLNGYGFPVLLDPAGKVAGSFGLTGVPETFIIGKEGILRKKIIGPTGFDSANAIQFFEALLRE